MLTLAPLESARFGLRIFRATLDDVDPAQLFARILTAGADLLILRTPPKASPAIRRLGEYGLAPIHADTLVTYACELQKSDPASAVENGFTIDTARDSDRNAIDDLITTVFTEYPNHYTANPLLARNDIVAGYREWALSHLRGTNRTAWVARVDGQVAALACSTFDKITGECQGTLHGVHPNFGRAGIYTALIRYTQQYFRKIGCKRLTIQTQAWNMSVQRVWAREGFVLADVHETFHINALLDTTHGVIERTILDFPGQTDSQIRYAFLKATLDAAGAFGEGTSLPASNITLTVVQPTASGEQHSLLIRAYDFVHNCGKRLVVGTLYGASGRLHAISRVVVNSP